MDNLLKVQYKATLCKKSLKNDLDGGMGESVCTKRAEKRILSVGFKKEERMLSSGTLRRARLCPARSVLRWRAKKE
jgi:hypothetical protein